MLISCCIQFVTGAAQGVDASRVVFAFARDKALPGSRWWRKINARTQTPVNAVWLVMAISALCGVLGFSVAAFTSLAGCGLFPALFPFNTLRFFSCHRASVIGLYTSYTVPIFLRITSGRSSFVPGPFCLGRWSIPIGSIAVAWVSFITVLLCLPSAKVPTAQTMSTSKILLLCLHD
jgi:amino acid transporter